VREIPTPTYQYEIDRLVAAYKRAVVEIQRELERLDLTDLSRANAQAALVEVARILASLNEEAAAWVEENIPQAARDGVVRALVSLGVVETVEEARSIAKFNRINKAMVDAAIADMQTDVLAVTQNINKRVRDAVRKATADAMRANLSRGINGRRTIGRDITTGIRKQLGDAADGAIRDAAGRVWKVNTYVDMLARTKLAETYREATTNEAVSRGALYAVISRHGAGDACKYHEGRIIRLTGEGDPRYPTYDQIKASGQCFHPSCRHSFSPLRDPNKLPESVRERADKQAQLGDKALATGKRNPKDVE
jgi:hypothetical protein